MPTIIHGRMIGDPDGDCEGCECPGGDCSAIRCGARKNWSYFSPFPIWSRGTFEFASGDGTEALATFLFMCGAVGFFVSSGLASPGYNGKGLSPSMGFGVGQTGDSRIASRYRTCVWDSTMTVLNGGSPGTPTEAELHLKWTETANRYSGRVSLMKGEVEVDGGGLSTYYEQTLDDAGVFSETGDAGDWVNEPAATYAGFAPVFYALGGLEAATDNGWTASLVVDTDNAELTVNGGDGIDPVEYVFTITLSDEYTLATAMTDVDAMLAVFDLSDLTTTYTISGVPGSTLSWSGVYLATYEHDDGVPLAMVYDYAGYAGTAVAARQVYYYGEIVVAKSLVRTQDLDTSLYSEEQTLAVPGDTLGAYPDFLPDNGVDSVYPDDTTCENPFTTTGTTEVEVGPADMAYTYGTATIAMECAGNTLCTP